MKAALQRAMAQAKTKPAPKAPPAAQEAPTAAPIARHWSDPDPGCYVAHKPSPAAPQASPSTLDAKMIAKLKAAVPKQPVIA